jgi:hypothetical protein
MISYQKAQRHRIVSPTRQMRKALHVSGRQFKKIYKAANLAEAARKQAARLPKPPEA